MNCATLVLGRPAVRAGWRKLLAAQGLARELAELAPSLDIVEAAHAGSSRRLPRRLWSRIGSEDGEAGEPGAGRLRWQGFLWALGASVAVTALATPLSGWLELTNIVMLYLVGVVAVAMRFGRAPAAMAALMNVLAFDFFFVSPRLSFAVSDVQYIVTLP